MNRVARDLATAALTQLPRLKRLVLSFVVALLAFFVGRLFGSFLVTRPFEVAGTNVALFEVVGTDVALDAGTVLAIVSFMVLIFKDGLLTVQRLGHYIWTGESLSIGEAFVLLAASTVATAIFSVVVLSTPPECPTSWTDCVSEELDSRCHGNCIVDYGIPHVEQVIRVAVEGSRKRSLLARIASSPLLFENAETRGMTSDGEPHLDEDSQGIRLQADHENQLRRIVGLFKSGCPRPEHATLFVVGSSSEARFKNMTERMSDALNAKAAELRGRNVAEALRNALSEGRVSANVKVEVMSWSTYSSVGRTAIDGVHYDSLLDPQYQARSVTVQVADAEACFGTI